MRSLGSVRVVRVVRATLPLAALAAAIAVAAVATPAPAAPGRGKDTGQDKGKDRGKPAGKKTAAEAEARAFLDFVTPLVVPVYTVDSELNWVASTDVTPEHTGARAGADRALAALVGSKLVIERCKALLGKRADLDEVTRRQLERLLLWAAETPGTIPDVVGKRVEAEARQSAILDGYTFCLQPKDARNPAAGCARPATANDIDNVLERSKDVAERERVWLASKQIGRPLKPGLADLVKLRNQVAREMGYSSFFGLQVADYGMSSQEMMKLLDDTLATTKPLYDGLHCWAKGQLARKLGKPDPGALIPAHWIGNRWAQEWPGLVEGANLDPLFAGRTPEWMVKSAEDFYVSLGFPRLPASFWKRSDLYPVPKGDPRKKNAHASAWDIDFGGDVRSLMSVEANAQWFGTAHHELGHIYYFLSYANPDVPLLVRNGANRAMHEAVGELVRLASEQTPYLRKMGIMPAGQEPDASAWLLASALDSIVFLPFSAGTMSHFEHDLYEQAVPPAEWQRRWWDYVTRFQGVGTPDGKPRPDDLCDACTKTHINDDAAQYYDYALATLIKFQLHDHICSKILKQDVRRCDYSGSKAVGDFLRGILRVGASRDWRDVIKDATGEAISPRALMEFYQPLLADLAKRNAGRACGR